MRRLRFSTILLLIACILTAWSSAPVNAEQTSTTFSVEVAEIEKSAELVKTLQAKGIPAVIFKKNSRIVSAQTNRVVWLGKNVPLEMVRETLSEAIRFNPFICYVHVVGDRGEKPPEKVHNTIHIGGSEEAALPMKLAVIPAEEIKNILSQVKTIEELHLFFHDKNAVKR